MTQTPAKYIPEDRDYENKYWLYEQYWGEKKSLRQIAEESDAGRRTIQEKFEEFGIPRRYPNYNRHNSISMFSGFYTDKAARADSEDIAVEKKTARSEDNSKLNWQKAAKHMDQVGDNAIFDKE